MRAPEARTDPFTVDRNRDYSRYSNNAIDRDCARYGPGTLACARTAAPYGYYGPGFGFRCQPGSLGYDAYGRLYSGYCF